MSLTIQWCDGPTPRASRPPATAWTDNAWRASATGCCAWRGTTAVPNSIVVVGPAGHQRHHGEGVEVVGHLRHPRGVQTRRLCPLDVGDELRHLARGVAAFGTDHYAKSHQDSPSADSVRARTSRTSVSSGVPVGNTAAAPT